MSKQASTNGSYSCRICVLPTAWKKEGPRLRPLIRRAVQATLRHEKVTGKMAVSIRLSDDAELMQLNTDFRGMPKPTNVLSFPDGSKDENGITQLGDAVLSMETLTREAQLQGKRLDDHLLHLIVHSVLHLLGYDHMKKAEANAMEAKETAILQRLGIKNPY